MWQGKRVWQGKGCGMVKGCGKVKGDANQSRKTFKIIVRVLLQEATSSQEVEPGRPHQYGWQ